MKKGLKKRAAPELQDIDKRVPLAEFLERPDIRALEHGAKSETFLRRECEFRGIQPSSNRALMEQRLQLFYAGDRVVTTELRKQVRLTTDTIVTTGDQHHQLAPVYARGEMTLLGLPHDVIRRCLLPHLTEIDDLFAMLYVCKHVHDDALAVLRVRAKNDLAIDGATPMALSAIRHWERWFALHFHLAISIHRRLTAAVRIRRYTKTIDKLQHAMRNAGFSRTYLAFGQRDVGGSSQCIRDSVMATITAYGSVEGLVRDRQRQRDLLLCKRTETEALLQDAPARAQAALQLLTEFGCPPLFTYSAEDGFVNLPVANVIWQLIDRTSKPCKFLKSIRPHICRGNPKELTRLRAAAGDTLPSAVTRILSWASTAVTTNSLVSEHSFSLLRVMFMVTGFRLCNKDLTDEQLAIQLNACALERTFRSLYTRNIVIWGTDLNQSPHVCNVFYLTVPLVSMFDLCHAFGLTRFTDIRVTYVHLIETDSKTYTYDMRDAFIRQAVFPVIQLADCRWIAIELLSNTHFIPL